MTSPQRPIHRIEDIDTACRQLRCAMHVLAVTALLAVALTITHAAFQTALALPDLMAGTVAAGW